MKILVFSNATENLKFVYEKTNYLKNEYCKKHGYTYLFNELIYDDNVYLQKFKQLKKLLELNEYDFIMYLDYEAWFNNFNIKIEDYILKYMENPKKDFLCSRDFIRIWWENENPNRNVSEFNNAYINSGVLLVRNTQDIIEMIEHIIQKNEERDKFISSMSALTDQILLQMEILFNSKTYSISKIINDPSFNFTFMGFPNYQYDKNTYILHAASLLTCYNQWGIENPFVKRTFNFINNTMINYCRK